MGAEVPAGFASPKLPRGAVTGRSGSPAAHGGMPRRHLLLTAPLLALLLAGCVPLDVATTPTPTASDEPTGPAVTPSATPTATITPAPDAIPLGLDCAELISAQAMSAFNPNSSLVTDYAPGVGALAARALDAKGVACRWVNQTSGVTIDISAARLNDNVLPAAMADARASADPVGDFDGDGYYSSGSAQVFNGSTWVTATSAAFTTAADAAQLVNVAVAAAG